MPSRSSTHPRFGFHAGWAFLLFLLGGTLELLAANSVQIKTNYYRVSGNSPREIERSLRQARPWKANMNARTRWEVKWQYTSSNSPGGTRLKSFSTTTRITITLPSYVPRRGAPPELVTRWNNYLAALSRHENGHRKHALNAAAEIRRRAAKLQPAPDDPALKRALSRVVDQVSREYRRKEAEYDRKTRHGTTQGAVFP